MGSSCSRACTSWKERNYRRCLLVGLDNSGKTTVLNTVCHNGRKETVPTTGFNTETVQVKKLSLEIWDVGGQEVYRPMWRHYITGTQAVIFVIDSTDVSRMELVKQEIQRLAINDQLRDTVWLLFANKQDEPNAVHSSQMELTLDLANILKDHSFKLFESVATKNIGVNDGFIWLEKQLKNMYRCLFPLTVFPHIWGTSTLHLLLTRSTRTYSSQTV